MVEYYKLRVPSAENVYLKVEDNQLSITAEDGPTFDNSTLVKITKEELKKALDDLK